MQPLSLFDLNEYIRRVLALNFREALWITAEVAACKPSRGHYYLDLIEKEATELLAQASAVLWARQYQQLRLTHGMALDDLLKEGVQLKLLVRVDFHERYGLKLVIEDIDPAYTYGQMELQRREALEQLRREGLLERNQMLSLPMALQRIAVISAETAAGWQDFREHLDQNIFGYAFSCTLFRSAMQGDQVALEFPRALAAIRSRATEFDAIVIVRGGGARIDLAAFDQLDLARAVALMPLPVLSGIGHDIDQTVVDLVAHTAMKTPTAVADFLVQHNLFFENSLLRIVENIRFHGEYRVKNNTVDLESMQSRLLWSARSVLRVQSGQVQHAESTLPALVHQGLRNAARVLQEAERRCNDMDPEQVLRRGYSITQHQGKVLRSASGLKAGDILETRLATGELRSVVERPPDLA
jgi:exodeoxyribonuclease VII large subunit